MSVPILAGDPNLWPTHVKENLLGLDAPPVTANNAPVEVKGGRPKHIVHRQDLLDSRGNPLKIYPLFADRAKAGNILLPNGHNMRVRGGPGFGSMPESYGTDAWASLPHNSKSDSFDSLTKPTTSRIYDQLIKENPEGWLGAIYVGGPNASAGNSAFLRLLGHHLTHKASKDGNEGKVQDFVRGVKGSFPGEPEETYQDIDDFINKLSKHSTTARASFLANLIHKKGMGKAGKELMDMLELPSALHHFNDYNHVPDGHIVAMVRTRPDSKTHHLTPEEGGHPIYPWHLTGDYIGDLLHSVPLGHVSEGIRHGSKPFQTPGGQWKIKPNPAGGEMDLGVFGMHNPSQLAIKPDNFGDAIKGIVIKQVDPPVAVLIKKSYNEDGGFKMSNWLPDYVKQPDPEHVAMFEKVERESNGNLAPTEDEQVELINKFKSPSVQAKLQQTLARQLPK